MVLKDKIALVTGASRGIGRAIAERLAADGALVAIHYKTNSKAADSVVQAINHNGGQAFAIGADISTVAGVKKLASSLDAELTKRTGSNRFDILVHNAGIGTSPAFLDTTEHDFDEVFSVNVKAPFFLTQACMSRLRDGGRVINISSGVTRIAYPHIMAYNLTKGAINTFTLHLAALLGERNITVNAILPGIIDTDTNSSWLHTPEGAKMAREASVFGRIGEPKDIAGVAAFLASPDSHWMTGQILDATGGAKL